MKNLLLFFASALLLADGPQTGILQGSVTDSEMGPLPGVSIVIEGAKGTRTTLTNSNGTYRFPSLEPGTYNITFHLSGFQTVKATIPVNVGLTTTLDATLRAESLEEVIQVTADSGLIDKENVSVGGNIKSDFTKKFALGRSYQNMVQLIAGVTGGGNPNVNGSLDGENLYLIDGVDTTDATTGTFGANLNSEAIQEIAVLTGGVGAEYGRAPGAVLNIVTKSGGNRFEGNIQSIITNQDWDSDSKHVSSNPVDHHTNPYNIAIGGPILKDKLFFFVTREDGTLTSFREGLVGPQGSYSRDFKATYDVFKFTWQPNQNHTIQFAHQEDPATLPRAYHGNTVSYDIDTVNLQTQGGKFDSLKWSWVISPEWVLDAQLANQDNEIVVEPWQQSEISGNPESPAGNHSTYYDFDTAYRHNGLRFDGFVRRPREQIGANITWFTTFGHDIKFGIDHQVTESQNQFQVYGGELYFGNGFNASAPGGYDNPAFVRRYAEPDNLISENVNTAIYIQDKVSFGKWFINAGLRFERQDGTNDVGETVINSTNIAPRLNVSYDLNDNGKFIFTAGYNRYFASVTSGLVDDFNRGVSAGAIYDVYNWNPDSLSYDLFDRTVDLSGNNATINEIEAYYEDEFLLGFNWQMNPDWALTSQYINSKVHNIFDKISDFDADGNLVSEFGTIEDAERKYNGIQINILRRLKNNWQMAANYTLSKAEGNFFSESDDTFGSYRSVSNLAVVNRYGKAPHDRTHMLKVFGNYLFKLGSRQELNLGSRLLYQSGYPWQLVQTTQVAGTNETVTEYLEPRGENRLPSHYTLGFQVGYNLRIWQSVEFHFKLDVFNATNQQKVININQTTGEVDQTLSSFQTPRNYRVVTGFRF